MSRFARAARAGDGIKGRCSIPIYSKTHRCGHRNSGYCVGGGNVFINGKLAQREGDTVVFTGCQHGGVGSSSEGSNSVYINNRRAVRVKDEIRCSTCSRKSYVVDGSSDVFIGE